MTDLHDFAWATEFVIMLFNSFAATYSIFGIFAAIVLYRRRHSQFEWLMLTSLLMFMVLSGSTLIWDVLNHGGSCYPLWLRISLTTPGNIIGLVALTKMHALHTADFKR